MPDYNCIYNHEDLAQKMKEHEHFYSELNSNWGRCIFRISERLRQGNEKAYSPQMVSIGPLHHGKGNLTAMEKHKTQFFWDYMKRTETDLHLYTKIVWENKQRLLNSYAEPLDLSTAELVKIVLVDAVFLIEVLLRNRYEEFQEKHDWIFKKPWLIQDIIPDLLLLENQLPLFIITDLFNAKKFLSPSNLGDGDSIPNLLHDFFKSRTHYAGIEANLAKLSEPDSKVVHFVDFLRSLNIPDEKFIENPKSCSTPSVTELYRAGVKFRAAESQNMFGFTFSDGVLKIPKLTISGKTERIIRNLVAFEQCHCEGHSYMNDYAVMMDHLVNTAKDVDLLIKHGIVDNRLADSGEAADVMNKLGVEAKKVVNKFYFAPVSIQLEAYSKVTWNRWWTNLMQDYFNSPWSIASVVAAVLIISLTLIQTVCSIISVTSLSSTDLPPPR